MNVTEKINAFEKKTNHILGGKTIVDKTTGISYNNSPVKDYYNNAIESGKLTPLASFELFQLISTEIDTKIVGITTKNGIVVKSKSYHFIARVIGSVEQRRNGVPIESILLALTNPDKIDPIVENANAKSQRFLLKGICAVTINPETGNLIQVNPLR